MDKINYPAMFIGTFGSSVLLNIYKPEIMFTKDGYPKEFALFNLSDKEWNDKTMIPWWFASILIGIISSQVYYNFT